MAVLSEPMIQALTFAAIFITVLAVLYWLFRLDDLLARRRRK